MDNTDNLYRTIKKTNLCLVVALFAIACIVFQYVHSTSFKG